MPLLIGGNQLNKIEQIKLVAIDLDGTLLDNDCKISHRTKKAIRKVREKGIEVTLATGRMFYSARPYADDLGLSLPLITYQGALVKVSGSGEILYQRTVDADLAQQVVALAKGKGVSVNFYVDDYVLVDKLTPECDMYSQKYNARFREVGDLSRFSHLKPLKLLVINYNESALNAFKVECNRIFSGALHITKSMPEYLEFLHPEATKAAGIDAVVRQMGINPKEVMAIGDSWNDLEMLEYAGMSVVMGNARDAIKEKADYVTCSNEDHGVAEALEMLLGKGGSR